MKIFPKSAKFKIIFKLQNLYKNSLKQQDKFDLRLLCKIAEVSLSGYYKSIKLIVNKETKEDKEKNDLKLIKEVSLKSKQKLGYRSIQMKLKGIGINMNHKKVLRLMNKYNLLAKIRRKNPYKNIMKASKEHRTCDNILNRNFNKKEVMKTLCTDITYLNYSQGRKAYLSVVKDTATREIISWELSKNLGIGFVLNTVDNLDKKLIGYKRDEIIINSDQGVHYTSPQYIFKIKKLGIIQSMSRRGNCLDNSPIESFFGHMKDDIDYESVKTYKKLENLINNYMNYYNNERYQWGIKKMTPVQYRNHLMSKN